MTAVGYGFRNSRAADALATTTKGVAHLSGLSPTAAWDAAAPLARIAAIRW
ncbi:hypothetical protein [Nocardia pneumoniae]|uniref:hypothetical protein n=1 Tax=Nocardia pneumoniae TaxID=228601 RepID=UPI0012F6DD7A|nr:hypothetical protein [Nocardia pneumoniae]